MNNNAEYYYAPVRRDWVVYRRHVDSDGVGFGERVESFRTREEARKRVYELNKWDYEKKVF
jgi:hypothetical protein